MTEDRRQFRRLPFQADIQLFSGNGLWNSQILDLSLKGALLKRPPNWQGTVGEIFRVKINLEDFSGITMSVEIAHIKEDSIGAKWTKIDVISFTKLKRLLELNFADPEQLEREIAHLSA